MSQIVPAFTPETLEILFEKSNFKAFQKPGYRSHYWAPLLSACSGLRRNEIFFLTADDVLEKEGIAIMRIPPGSSEKAPAARATRDIPIHATLKRLGFLGFVEQRKQSYPNERLFSEYKAIHEHAGMLFSRAFVNWIKTTRAGLPEDGKRLFADDFHFPALRAFFFVEAKRCGMSDNTLQHLQGISSGGHQAVDAEQEQRNLGSVDTEMQRVDIESRFPALAPYEELMT
jgi:integrase